MRFSTTVDVSAVPSEWRDEYLVFLLLLAGDDGHKFFEFSLLAGVVLVCGVAFLLEEAHPIGELFLLQLFVLAAEVGLVEFPPDPHELRVDRRVETLPRTTAAQ